MALARDLQARALAAKDDAVAADLALAFHRVSRSLRQTLALRAKLGRDHTLGLRDDAKARARDVRDRVYDRKKQVRAALSRLIWTEAESQDDAEQLIDVLDAHLDDAALLDETFADQPLADCIARIGAEMRLVAANSDEVFPEGVLKPPQSLRDSSP
jgi:hypothetical protein